MSGTRLGIKYNRPVHEYPDAVLDDLDRFHQDRLNTIMLSLPWKQWADPDGQLKREFVDGPLSKVLSYCEKMDIPVILSVHCSFWGKKGDWSIPPRIVSTPSYVSASSVLTEPKLQKAYVSFLREWIAATSKWRSVVGYNILNEPVAATKYWVSLKSGEFQDRWTGVISIVRSVRDYLKTSRLNGEKILMVGTANGDPDYAEYVWNNTGRFDLKTFWTETLDVISGQYLDVLKVSEQWYPYRPKIRTEGFLGFAVQKARSQGKAYRWQKGEDQSAMFYDYDAVYDYEGLGNADIKGLQASYVWRIGSPDGSRKHLWIFDHRHGDRPTPYYYALRDLASGVDSFEAYPSEKLPRNKSENLAFDPLKTSGSISRRWTGSGQITASKTPSPVASISTMSAAVELAPGQFVAREVIATHWQANGVTPEDSFVFDVRSDRPTKFTLFVDVEGKRYSGKISLKGTGWETKTYAMKTMGISIDQVPLIKAVGIMNDLEQPVRFLIDEFLIR
jgi:hypothetical protein